jgi:hypothetical protein
MTPGLESSGQTNLRWLAEWKSGKGVVGKLEDLVDGGYVVKSEVERSQSQSTWR